MQKRQFERKGEHDDKIKEKLIYLNRVAKVVKGGRRFSFSALVAVGNGEGKVGLGFGKANEVAEAIRKAIADGKKNMFDVNLKGTTIPYQIIGESGAAKVLLKPATQGTGVIAGGAVRPIVELAGVKNILTKSLGTKNKINTAKATIEGLRSLLSDEEFAARRAIEPEETKKKKRSKRDAAPIDTPEAPVVAEVVETDDAQTENLISQDPFAVAEPAAE